MDTDTPHPAEQILWSGKTSQWHFFGLWVIALLGVAILTVLLIGLHSQLAQSVPRLLPWLYALPVLMVAVLFCSIWVQRAARRYCVTERRVILETGLLATSSSEIRVQDIRSINVKKSGISGLLGVGDVEFSSAATDDADVIFTKVAGADTIRDMVRKLQS